MATLPLVAAVEVGSASSSASLRFFDPDTLDPLSTPATFTEEVYAVSYSPDGTKLLVNYNYSQPGGETIAVLDATTLALLWHTANGSEGRFSDDSSRLMVSDGYDVYVHDAATGSLLGTVYGSSGRMPAGNTVLFSNYSDAIRQFDTATWEEGPTSTYFSGGGQSGLKPDFALLDGATRAAYARFSGVAFNAIGSDGDGVVVPLGGSQYASYSHQLDDLGDILVDVTGAGGSVDTVHVLDPSTPALLRSYNFGYLYHASVDPARRNVWITRGTSPKLLAVNLDSMEPSFPTLDTGGAFVLAVAAPPNVGTAESFWTNFLRTTETP